MLANVFKRLSPGRLFFALGILSGAVVTMVVDFATAETSASPERSAAAVGHYARARALLTQALIEFEEGRKLARPDLLLDPEEWRTSVVSRAEELNRVLDPQPRVTRSGARFEATPELIRKEGEKPKTLSFTPAKEAKKIPRAQQQRNVEVKTRDAETKKSVSEIIRVRPVPKIEASAAELEPLKSTEEPETENKPQTKSAEAVTIAPKKVEPIPTPVQIPAKANEKSEFTKSVGNTGASAPAIEPAAGSPASAEDPEIAEAINKAIRERLERLSGEKTSQSSSQKGLGK
jgi:hypothetical protein